MVMKKDDFSIKYAINYPSRFWEETLGLIICSTFINLAYGKKSTGVTLLMS